MHSISQVSFFGFLNTTTIHRQPPPLRGSTRGELLAAEHARPYILRHAHIAQYALTRGLQCDAGRRPHRAVDGPA